MTEHPAPRILSAESAAALAEFARACKAAARAVSLYPGAHPAITSSLGRLAQLSGRMTERGPYRVTVLADALLVDGASMPKPDVGVTELAELLHRHLIGRLTINAGANGESWRSLLLLLARTPESVRADGGIRHLWATAGGPSIELDQIDYVEVLRDKQGVAAALEQILAAALSGTPLELDDSGMRLLLEIVQEPARLADFMRELDEAGGRHGADVQAAAFLHLVRALTDWLARHDPLRIDPVFQELGRAAGRLSAEAMLKLLDLRSAPESAASGLDVASAVVERMGDDSVSGFVARSVVKERGATERLAHAFQALVPDLDRQRRLLALAEAEVRASERGTEEFPELWARVESMLTSYTDESFVSDQYARELSRARTQPVDVERASDDPPERISAWVETVSDASLRTLDQRLLTDLLAIETDPLRWRDIADTAAAHVEDLIRVGHFDRAWQVAGVIVSEADREPTRRAHASTALERFARGSLMHHVAGHLRSADEASYEQFKSLCHTMGHTVIPALAEVLSSEQDARSRRRLRDILLGFGAKGRESVRQLMNAPNWEVRRTAAHLLREFGGAQGLRELIPLLSDPEPLVQREAVQALVIHGSDDASKILLEAVTSASGRSRERLMNELTGMREERAVPFFCYLVRHLDRRTDPELYLAGIEMLATIGGTDAVEALRAALYQGDWWSPIVTRRIRTAAARALKTIGTEPALAVLREAAVRGGRGIRAAARAHLPENGIA